MESASELSRSSLARDLRNAACCLAWGPLASVVAASGLLQWIAEDRKGVSDEH
jgi:hypothetical protein